MKKGLFSKIIVLGVIAANVVFTAAVLNVFLETSAEQIYRESGMGEKKFAYVKEWIQKKFNVSDEDLTKSSNQYSVS